MSRRKVSMNLYFMHIKEGADITFDPEGSRLPSLEAAREMAIESARELMAEAVAHGDRISLARTFEIHDERGRLLLTVPFRDAIDFSDAA
jgi:hypothetical protein